MSTEVSWGNTSQYTCQAIHHEVLITQQPVGGCRVGWGRQWGWGDWEGVGVGWRGVAEASQPASQWAVCTVYNTILPAAAVLRDCQIGSYMHACAHSTHARASVHAHTHEHTQQLVQIGLHLRVNKTRLDKLVMGAVLRKAINLQHSQHQQPGRLPSIRNITLESVESNTAQICIADSVMYLRVTSTVDPSPPPHHHSTKAIWSCGNRLLS